MENFIDFLEMGDEKNEKSCNQSQHVKEPAYCNEGLYHLQEDEGPKWDVSSCS